MRKAGLGSEKQKKPDLKIPEIEAKHEARTQIEPQVAGQTVDQEEVDFDIVQDEEQTAATVNSQVANTMAQGEQSAPMEGSVAEASTPEV